MEGLDPQSLITLWNIERLGSFSAVARETGWSQPAISQQIKKCEQRLGITLVRRTSHGVKLTPEGLLLSRHGQIIEKRLNQAQQDLEAFERRGAAHIRLVAPPSACSSFVARALAHMSWSSSVRVSLMQMEPPEALDALERGMADCAVVFRYPIPSVWSDPDEDMKAMDLGRDPLQLLVRVTDPLARRHRGGGGDAMELREACDEHWIAGCNTCQSNLISLARRAGFVPHIVHATDDYWTTENMVELGLGVSLVPRLSTMTHLQDDLIALPIADDDAYRTVCLVTRQGDDRPSLRRVSEELTRTAGRYLLNDARTPSVAGR